MDDEPALLSTTGYLYINILSLNLIDLIINLLGPLQMINYMLLAINMEKVHFRVIAQLLSQKNNVQLMEALLSRQ